MKFSVDSRGLDPPLNCRNVAFFSASCPTRRASNTASMFPTAVLHFAQREIWTSADNQPERCGQCEIRRTLSGVRTYSSTALGTPQRLSWIRGVRGDTKLALTRETVHFLQFFLP